MKKSGFWRFAVPAAMLMSGSAQAAYTTYFGEDLNSSPTIQVSSIANSLAAQTSFLSTLTGAGVEDFESRSGSGPLALSFAGYGGGTLSATLTGTGTVATNPAGGTNTVGRYSVPGGTHYWEANLSGSSFQITFGQQIAAFGFYGIDIGDFGGRAIVDLYNGSSLITSLAVPNTIGSSGSTDGSVLYFGVTAGTSAETFNTIKFRTTLSTSDVFAFDSFTIAELRQVAGTDVPEPTTVALVGCALLALGMSRRRGA